MCSNAQCNSLQYYGIKGAERSVFKQERNRNANKSESNRFVALEMT